MSTTPEETTPGGTALREAESATADLSASNSDTDTEPTPPDTLPESKSATAATDPAPTPEAAVPDSTGDSVATPPDAPAVVSPVAPTTAPGASGSDAASADSATEAALGSEGVPAEPGQGDESSQSDDSAVAEEPAPGDVPAQSGEPVLPDEPAQGGEPAQSGEPVLPDEPAQGGEPKQEAQPALGDEPEGSPDAALPSPPRPREKKPSPTVATSDWGRVTADGRVYVRTVEGEREVGTWLASRPSEGLAYYERRYEDLRTAVELLTQRAGSTAADPRAVRNSARQVLAELDNSHVVGDVESLRSLLHQAITAAEGRISDTASARAAERAAAAQRKRALVEEAEQLAETTAWKASGDRIAQIGEELRGIRGPARATDAELYKRYTAARAAFNRARGAHFSALGEQRKAAAQAREQLVAEAEALSDSTDWQRTANRLKELMAEWKAGQRASREQEDVLFKRFRAAQDQFFGRRHEMFQVRDREYQANQERKQALLDRAERVDLKDQAAASRMLRELRTEWDEIGKVPRDSITGLESRLHRVEAQLRTASRPVADRRRVTGTAGGALVEQLREALSKLETQAERARAAGDEAKVAELEESIAARRMWLEQAERNQR